MGWRSNRDKTQRRPWVRQLLPSTEGEWEEGYDDTKPQKGYMPNYPCMTPTVDPSHLEPLSFTQWEIDDTIPLKEHAWMRTQLKADLDSIQSFKWKPRNQFNIGHIGLYQRKLRKHVTGFGERDMTEEAFRSNVSSAAPVLVYRDSSFDRHNNLMMKRVERALAEIKRQLPENRKNPDLIDLFKEIATLHSSPFYHHGPSIATYAKNEIEAYETEAEINGTAKGSKFVRWMIGENEVILWKLPTDQDWFKVVGDEMQKLPKSDEIYSNLEQEVFELTVPKNNFKILIGMGGECEFLRPDEAGCSLVIVERPQNSSHLSSQWPLNDNLTERRKLSSFEPRRFVRSIEEKVGATYVATYRDPKRAEAARDEWETEGTSMAFVCPKNFLLGDYCQNATVTESVSIRFRWQKAPPKSYICLTIKEPSLIRYTGEVFGYNGFAANIKYRHIGAKELEVSTRPDNLRSDEEAIEWIYSLLTPAGVQIESVTMPRHNPQEFDLKLQTSICTMLSSHFVRSAIDRKVWVDGSANNPKDSLTMSKYVKDYSKFPWKFDFQSDDDVYNEVTVTFENLDQGIAIVKQMIYMVDKRRIILNPNEATQIDHIPQYVRKMDVPSYLRPIFEDELKYFNENPFDEDVPQEIAKWIKICDFPSASLNTDTIGVCGWPKSYVDRGFDFLQSLFIPTIFEPRNSAENWIFFGVGAAWLHKKLEEEKQSMDFFYDVDVTRRQITFWGLEARRQEVLDKICIGIMNRYSMKISTSISIAPPCFPSNFYQLIDFVDEYFASANANGFARLLQEQECPKIGFNMISLMISIEGTVAQYERLQKLLDDLAQIAFKSQNLVMENRHLWASNCGICLNPVHQDYYCLEICGHHFCRDCINMQVLGAQRSRDMRPFVCAYENCGQPFVVSDVKRLLLGAGGGFMLEDRAEWLDAEKLAPFITASLDRLLTRPGSIYFACITPDCKGIFERKRPPAQLCCDVVKCNACSRVICSFCGLEEHPFYSCTDYKELRKDANRSLEKYMWTVGRDNITICPMDGCQAVIEKTQGCNHMQCLRCRIHFCWICKYIGSDDREIYRHLAEKHGGPTDDPWAFDEAGNLIGMPAGEEEALIQMVNHFRLMLG